VTRLVSVRMAASTPATVTAPVSLRPATAGLEAGDADFARLAADATSTRLVVEASWT
jgi:hypothetical protein